MLRYLRIAFSATCLIVCVLLIALWVRSYWCWDTAYFQLFHSPTVAAISAEGRFFFGLEAGGSAGSQMQLVSRSISGGIHPFLPSAIAKTRFRFNAVKFPSGRIVEIPPYFFIAIASCVAATPWIPGKRQFALRTLLIATTLVAVVLGMIVWLGN